MQCWLLLLATNFKWNRNWCCGGVLRMADWKHEFGWFEVMWRVRKLKILILWKQQGWPSCSMSYLEIPAMRLLQMRYVRVNAAWKKFFVVHSSWFFQQSLPSTGESVCSPVSIFLVSGRSPLVPGVSVRPCTSKTSASCLWTHRWLRIGSPCGSSRAFICVSRPAQRAYDATSSWDPTEFHCLMESDLKSTCKEQRSRNSTMQRNLIPMSCTPLIREASSSQKFQAHETVHYPGSIDLFFTYSENTAPPPAPTPPFTGNLKTISQSFFIFQLSL